MPGRRKNVNAKSGGAEVAEARLVTLNDPDGVPAEAYRTLRTSLLYSFVDDPPRVIMMTSPSPREGKSTSCSNLGVALSQAGKRTLIVDCDLRKPVMHRIFGLSNECGVVDLVAGEMMLQQVRQEITENLFVVSSGPIPPNPAELLGSDKFAAVMKELNEDFEYVLVDAPPVQVVSDASIVATHCDGVLLVVDAQSTRKKSVPRSIGNLKSVGANVLGTVMNNVKATDDAYYGYSYSYTN